MGHTDAWLDDIFRVGGDTEPPPSPNIPTDYLPTPRRNPPTSSPPDHGIPIRGKRKRPALAEIGLPNNTVSKSREASTDSSPSKRRRLVFAEIVPLDMASRSRSPKKKVTTSDRKEDENVFLTDNAADPDATPRRTRQSNRVAIRAFGEAIIPLESTLGRSKQLGTAIRDADDGLDQQDTSVDESADSKNSKRSLSPTKRMVDLRVIEKKVEEKGVTSPSDIPSDIQGLYFDIQTLGISGCGVVPKEIKDRVEMACKGIEPLLPFMVASQGAGMDREQLLEELKELIQIRNDTSFCNNKKVHEPSWNERVHSRILQQAVKYLPGIEYYNVTTARVLRELVPDNIYGETLKKKMVDYVITLTGPIIAENDVAARLGSSVGKLRRTINPSDYSPLCYDPIAISIEIKTPDGSQQDAKVQLSLWIIAQFNRFRDLLPTAIAQEPISITLPLLFVSGESWTLLFAHDQDDSIEIIGSVLIGSTASILGCYKILAAIRCLCKWATITFKNWFIGNILTPE